MLLRILINCAGLLCSAALTSSAHAGVTSVDSSGRVLMNGVPFEAKGFNYVTVPIGTPAARWDSHPEDCERDAVLLERAGANIVRIWIGGDGAVLTPSGTRCLDAFHAHGVGVLWVIPVSHTKDVGVAENVLRNRAVVGQAVSSFKDHPATALWTIGNEINLDCGEGSDDGVNGQTCRDIWYGTKGPGGSVGALNALLQRARAVDSQHLVGTSINTARCLATMAAANLPDIQFWGVNAYGFAPCGGAPTFTARLAAASIDDDGLTRPVLITETGRDRYRCMAAPDDVEAPRDGVHRFCDSTNSYEDPATQSTVAGANWGYIDAGSTAGEVFGGVYFVWADVWDVPCFLCTPMVHDTLGLERNGTSDPELVNKEWWGHAHAQLPGVTDLRPTTPAVDTLAREWRGGTGWPTISNLSATPNAACDLITVKWDTAQPATTEVHAASRQQMFARTGFFADSAAYRLAASSDAYATHHEVSIRIPSVPVPSTATGALFIARSTTKAIGSVEGKFQTAAPVQVTCPPGG